MGIKKLNPYMGFEISGVDYEQRKICLLKLVYDLSKLQ
jgi:hypothetical protein